MRDMNVSFYLTLPGVACGALESPCGAPPPLPEYTMDPKPHGHDHL